MNECEFRTEKIMDEQEQKMTDLKHLRALCDAATQGKWYTSTEYSEDYYHWGYSIGTDQGDNDNDVVFCGIDEANARFIAAADPQTVRALIDEIERLRGALEAIDTVMYCEAYIMESEKE